MADNNLTITLTNRSPVTVNKTNWPIIARSDDHDGQVESQANRRSKLLVRQHADGRTIIYGIYDTQWQNESDRRGGQYLSKSASMAQIVDAINEVGEYLSFERHLIDECIADLPAEILD